MQYVPDLVKHGLRDERLVALAWAQTVQIARFKAFVVGIRGEAWVVWWDVHFLVCIWGFIRIYVLGGWKTWGEVGVDQRVSRTGGRRPTVIRPRRRRTRQVCS